MARAAQKGKTMNNLETYVKETLENHLSDYDGKMEDVICDAARGTSTGWWNDLIYTADILSLFPSFKKGIAKALASYADQTGESALDTVHIHNEFTAEHAMLSMVSTPDEIKENDTLTNAACWLVSFGVEWSTHEYASQNGIEY